MKDKLKKKICLHRKTIQIGSRLTRLEATGMRKVQYDLYQCCRCGKKIEKVTGVV